MQKYTLARFRQTGADQGGVDLLKVQSELEERIDDLLAARLRRGVNLWTLIVVLGVPVQILVMSYAAHLLLSK